jgi:hypothetical protein
MLDLPLLKCFFPLGSSGVGVAPANMLPAMRGRRRVGQRARAWNVKIREFSQKGIKTLQLAVPVDLSFAEYPIL